MRSRILIIGVIVVGMVGAASAMAWLFLGSDRAFVVFLASTGIANSTLGAVGVLAPQHALLTKRLSWVLLLIGIAAFTRLITGNVAPPVPSLRS